MLNLHSKYNMLNSFHLNYGPGEKKFEIFPSLKLASQCGGKKQEMQSVCGVVRPAPLALHQSARPTQSSRTLYGYLFQHSHPPSPLSVCEQANSVVTDTLRVPVSTFAPSFTTVCIRTSQLCRRGHFAVPVSTFEPSFTDVCMRTSREYLYVCECRRKLPAPTMCSPAALRQEASVDDRVRAQQDLRHHRVIKSHACIAVTD